MDSTIGVYSSVVNAECGESDGSINLNVQGGSGSYSYQWSNGATSQDIDSLSAGTYEVTITDNLLACNMILSYNVSNNNFDSISATIVDAHCGSADGAIDLTVNGNGSYSYEWSNGATTEDLVNVFAGEYTVTVTDTSGCKAIRSYTIGYTDSLAVNAVVLNASCGLSNGAIDVTVANGSGSYSYQWSNGESTEDLSNLMAGIYVVTVTDMNSGCEAVGIFAVSEEGAPVISLDNLTGITCAGDEDGSIEISVSGGSGSYSYSWSNGESTEDIYNLPAGTYLVEVRDDSSGCVSMMQFVIEDKTPIGIAADVTPTICDPNAAQIGAIDIEVSGGTTPYSYTWTGPQGFSAFTQDISGLVQGNYTLTVTDANGCSMEDTIYVNCRPEEPKPEDPKPIRIYNVITPNGDGYNDFWVIDNFDASKYPDNELLIFNRWGDLVYEAKPYDNEWRGQLFDTGEEVPDGTYFYILKLNESGDRIINQQQVYQGYVVVQR